MPSDAEIIRLWAHRGVTLLKNHIDEINSLNVFPVPDGDTGTNLYLTFESAYHFELKRHGQATDVVDALSALAEGAMQGARGNSGIILAEALRGSFEAAQKENYSLQTLLKAAAARAKRAVDDPQPGTILSVLDAISEIPTPEITRVANRAREVLVETQGLLPQLQKAGVVDAGGRGLVVLLDALAQVCTGIDAESPSVGYVPQHVPIVECKADKAFEIVFKMKYAEKTEIEQAIDRLGTSLSITSDGKVSVVHIHSDSPSEVLSEIGLLANVWDVSIEKLEAAQGQIGCVCITEGAGNVMNLVSLGVIALDRQAKDVTSDDLFGSVLKSNHKDVLLICDQRDVPTVMSVQDRLRDFDKTVHPVQSDSVVSTLAGASVFHAELGVNENLELIQSVIASMRVITLRNLEADLKALETVSDTELVTVVWGQNVSDDERVIIQNTLKERVGISALHELQGNQKDSIAVIGFE